MDAESLGKLRFVAESRPPDVVDQVFADRVALIGRDHEPGLVPDLSGEAPVGLDATVLTKQCQRVFRQGQRSP